MFPLYEGKDRSRGISEIESIAATVSKTNDQQATDRDGALPTLSCELLTIFGNIGT